MHNTLELQLSLADKLGIIDANKNICLVINTETSVDIPRIRVKDAVMLFGDFKVVRTELVVEPSSAISKPTLMFYLSKN